MIFTDHEERIDTNNTYLFDFLYLVGQEYKWWSFSHHSITTKIVFTVSLELVNFDVLKCSLKVLSMGTKTRVASHTDSRVFNRSLMI